MWQSGFNAQNSNTTGNSNTAVGNNTLFSNTTGKFNTAVGWSAGSVSDKNNYCTFLGYDADQAGAADYNNSMALGNKASITANKPGTYR
jgi:hypothetical protein